MPSRLLVVAHQTLGGADLTSAVRERVLADATEVWIVAPVGLPRDDMRLGLAAGAGPIDPLHPGRSARDDSWEIADRRLRDGVQALSALGVPVGGEVGDSDPFRAVRDALSHREVDEVLVSTLPTDRSRWLRADLPSRVHRRLGVPVTTVTARPAHEH
jgi:hypothetical protein